MLSTYFQKCHLKKKNLTSCENNSQTILSLKIIIIIIKLSNCSQKRKKKLLCTWWMENNEEKIREKMSLSVIR